MRAVDPDDISEDVPRYDATKHVSEEMPKRWSHEDQAEAATAGAYRLEADAHERWEHPSGAFHLEAMPAAFQPRHRQRSDRPTRHRINQIKTRRNHV